MAHDGEEEEWIEEVKQREGFVLDEHSYKFDEDHALTYRRVQTTPFVTSQFDHIHDEDPFTLVMSKSTVSPPPPQFCLEPKNTALLSPQQAMTIDFEESETLPIGPVPEVVQVNYLEVNPMFESEATAEQILKTLKTAIKPHVEEFQCLPDWSIDVYALIAAEEVLFNIQLHRIVKKNRFRVDFNLRTGDEFQFLDVVDRIRRDCQSIDRACSNLPPFSADILSNWSSIGEMYPGSPTMDLSHLLLLFQDITSIHSHPFTRYEAAKQLKACCQVAANRDILRNSAQEELVVTLDKMLQDENEDIIRFAIFVILSFGQDQAAWRGFNLPELPQMLQTIEQTVQKRSTKKLVNDLNMAIHSSNSIVVDG